MAKRQTATKKKPSRGSSNKAKPAPPIHHAQEQETTTPQLPIPEQQHLLDHFAAAFSPVLASPTLPHLLQETKQALFARDFAAAFPTTTTSSSDRLDAYAARWSPPRALCYAAIFRHHLRHTSPTSTPSAAAAAAPSRPPVSMICIGGAAAEHVAFASHLHHSPPTSDASADTLVLIDSAPWAATTSKLQHTLANPLPRSSSSVGLLPAHVRPRMLRRDVLDLTAADWRRLVPQQGPGPSAAAARLVVVTLLFTLNELYTAAGVARTTRFLRALEAALPDGSLLLVVDSPGSYAECTVGTARRRYPMQWLLHHTLSSSSSDDDDDDVDGDDRDATAPPRPCRWKRLESHDSIWFRLSDQLYYPIPLENMRHQLHLYRLDKTHRD